MPLNHVSKVFAVKDAKVRPILTDPSGGTTTFGTSVDVPGVKSVTVSGDITTAQLRGDNVLLDQQSLISGLTVAFEYAKLSLDMLKAFMGGAITDTGTTPAQIATLGLTAANAALGYFEFEAQAVGADSIAGDSTVRLYKCILTSFPDGLGMAEEDYITGSVEAGALPRLSDGKWLDVALHETAVVLA